MHLQVLNFLIPIPITLSHTFKKNMPCANCSCQNKSGCSSVIANGGASAPLRLNGKKTAGERTRLWATTEGSSSQYGSTNGNGDSTETEGLLEEAEEASSSTSTSGSPPAKCEKHNGVRGVCCRELKREERHLIDPDVVRDVIIGLSDGLTVPFALTAGLSGVGSTRIVVLAGLAELVSGAISMGVGGLLSAQAEVSHYNYKLASTSQRVQQSCSGELEREVCSILEPFGVPEEIGAMVAAKLQNVEQRDSKRILNQITQEGGQGLPAPATSSNSVPPPPPTRRSDGLVGPERGLTPFLLRMGEGLEKVEESRVWQSAIVIGTSYFVGGFIPLLPYILLASIQQALFMSIAITGIVLLIFGVAKQKATGAASDTKGLIWGAFSTLFVGAAAAGSSWIIVRALEGGSA
jgi:vacuolar iron transporter family protein